MLTTSEGTAFREIRGKLFPSVGMKKSGEHVRVNFGQSPFVFDIDGMMSASIFFHSDVPGIAEFYANHCFCLQSSLAENFNCCGDLQVLPT